MTSRNIDLEKALSSLDESVDGRQLLVSGRDVLKVIEMQDDGLSFGGVTSFRTSRGGMDLTTVDAKWSPHEATKHVFATAAANGSVLLWDTAIRQGSRRFRTYKEHSRVANCVSWDPHSPNLLCSASQDGLIKLWDTREPSSVRTLSSHRASVRDVQFSPTRQGVLAAALDDGLVQLWDIGSGRVSSTLSGHHGPVLTLRWHPEYADTLASAGRDQMVQVWDTRSAESVHSVQIATAVGSMSWRPGFPSHLATCSQVMDTRVFVWNLRRPAVPIYSFPNHRDVVTAALWPRAAEGRVIFTACRDGLLRAHVVDTDAVRPWDSLRPSALSWNAVGQLASATEILVRAPLYNADPSLLEQVYFSSTPPAPDAPAPSSARSSRLFAWGSSSTRSGDTSPPSRTSAEFVRPLANRKRVVHVQLAATSEHDVRVFRELATRYTLHTKEPLEACLANAALARELEAENLASLWTMLALMLGWQSRPLDDLVPPSVSTATLERIDAAEALRARVKELALVAASSNGRGSDPFLASSDGARAVRSSLSISAGGNLDSPWHTAPFAADDEALDYSYLGLQFSQLAHEVPRLDRVIEARLRPVDSADFTLHPGARKPLAQQTDMSLGGDDAVLLPSDGVMRLIGDHLSTVARPVDTESDIDDELSVSDAGSATPQSPRATPGTPAESSPSRTAVFVAESTDPLPRSVLRETLQDLLRTCAEDGDVQTCVALALVLGDLVEIDPAMLTRWTAAYHAQLLRSQLSTAAANLLLVCPRERISPPLLKSTTIHVSCVNCGRDLPKSGRCTRCNFFASSCVICHRIVRGMFAWCQGCGHGGHLLHMRNWFLSNSECPGACGHQCVYTFH